MSLSQHRKWVTTSVCLLALGSLLGSLALGGGGGTVPPGTIYFSLSSNPWDMSMNGSDGGKMASNPGTPSYRQHGDKRWFMVGGHGDGPLDPNGNPPVELFAVSEFYQYVIQLTDDPDIQWTNRTLPSWSKDDSFFSFTGVQNTATGVLGGLFVVDVDWSTGFPIAGPPTLVLEAETTTWGWWSWADVNLWEHDWSPDGNQLVFTEYDAVGVAQLLVASFTDVGVLTSHLTNGANAVWSPDGSRIAFNRGEIWTIRPNGTSAIRLTQSSATSKSVRKQNSPTWSPDGVFLAFTDSVTAKSGSTTYTVQRIPAAGGTPTNLTTGFNPRWRP